MSAGDEDFPRGAFLFLRAAVKNGELTSAANVDLLQMNNANPPPRVSICKSDRERVKKNPGISLIIHHRVFERAKIKEEKSRRERVRSFPLD